MGKACKEPVYDREDFPDGSQRIIFGIINQLRKGMDLSKITLPTFVLEPRSMCERILDIMSNVELVEKTAEKEDPVDRFIDVLKYFLSGWYIRPKGVKKPYNPILGEFFRCTARTREGNACIYVCEQVSHHPPASAYFFSCPKSDIFVQGEVWPKSSFLGNSVSMKMQGKTRMFFFNKTPREEYIITLPSMYARGVLFGSMYLELCDSVTIKCPQTGMIADIDFHKKGIFGDTMNQISGKIRVNSKEKPVYFLEGCWSSKVYIMKDSKNAPKTLLFDTEKLVPIDKIVEDISLQEEFESRNLWKKVTEKIVRNDMDSASNYKDELERKQRELVKYREANNKVWTPRFFQYSNNKWSFDISGLPNDKDKAFLFLKEKIFNAPKCPDHKYFWNISEGSTSSEGSFKSVVEDSPTQT